MKRLFILCFSLFLLTACTTSKIEEQSISAIAYEQLSANEQSEIKDKESAVVSTIKLEGPYTVLDNSYREKDVYKVEFKDEGITVILSIDTNKIIARPGVI